MENVLFRTAVGGFHRKDVLDYLEVLTREHGEALRECRKERDDAWKEAKRLMDVVSQADARAKTMETERARVMEAWDRKCVELEGAKAQIAALTEELHQNQAALEDCQNALEAERTRVSALLLEAESYAAVKDRLSNIELSAHQRAAEVERAAELEAENIQRKARENVLSLQMQYELAVSSLDTGRRQVTEQLCDMQMALDALAPILEQSGKTLVTLCEERCKSQKHPKGQDPSNKRQEAESI